MWDDRIEKSTRISEKSNKPMMPQRRVFRVGSQIWRVVGLRVRVMYLKAIIKMQKENGIDLMRNTPGNGYNMGREVNRKNGKFNFIKNPYKK
ncbi:hypothetical protein TU65_16310 [Bacillus wiedmannii]|nr:hypothetical protein TU65_16310 [Bacillus wiedmannii]